MLFDEKCPAPTHLQPEIRDTNPRNIRYGGRNNRCLVELAASLRSDRCKLTPRRRSVNADFEVSVKKSLRLKSPLLNGLQFRGEIR